MADGSPATATPPATPPSEPVAAPATPPAGEATTSQPEVTAASIMQDDNPENFLKDYLETAGLELPTEQPPQLGAPAAPPVQPPAAPGNGQLPASGQAPQQPAPGTPPGEVDQAQLQRLMTGQVPPQAPPQAYPQYQGPPSGQTQGQPPPQPPQNPDEPVIFFNQPFAIPPELAQGLDADDPRVRMTAIGSMMASAANHAANAAITHFKKQLAPQLASATVGRVQQMNVQDQINRELYGNFPHLRYVHPSLVTNAASIVVQDELARNPAAMITPDIVKRIGTLADAAARQIAGGQPPAPMVAPQPPPSAPPPGWTPPPQPQPQWLWNGQQWVQAAAPPQPPAPMWMAGGSAGGFGGPPAMGPTPDSEFADFLGGRW